MDLEKRLFLNLDFQYLEKLQFLYLVYYCQENFSLFWQDSAFLYEGSIILYLQYFSYLSLLIVCIYIYIYIPTYLFSS